MSKIFEMVYQLQTKLDHLNKIMLGDANDTVEIDGVVKPSISKEIADQWSPISAMVANTKSYRTKAEMDADNVHPDNTVAVVWSDPSLQNNGFYGMDSGRWKLSKYGQIANSIVSQNVTHAVTGGAIYDATSITELNGNRFDSTTVSNGYLPVNAPFNGHLLDKESQARTSDYIYVGDLSVGDLLYISGFTGDDMYGKGYAYYGKNKELLSIRSNDHYGWRESKFVMPGRPSNEVFFIRITVRSMHQLETTNIDNVTISNHMYAVVNSDDAYCVEAFLDCLLAATYGPISPPSHPRHILTKAFSDANLLSNSDLITRPLLSNIFNYLDSGVISPFRMPINPITSEPESYADHTISGYISCKDLVVGDPLYFYNLSPGWNRYVYFYDKDKNPILRDDVDNEYLHRVIPGPNSDNFSTVIDFKHAHECAYFRFTVKTSHELDKTDLQKVMITPYKNARYSKYEEELVAIKQSVVGFKHKISTQPDSANIFDLSSKEIERAYLWWQDNGELFEIQDESTRLTGFINIQNIPVGASLYIRGTRSFWGRYIGLYDDKKNQIFGDDPTIPYCHLVKGTDGDPSKWVEIKNFRPVEQIKYARFTVKTAYRNEENEDNTELSQVQISINPIEHYRPYVESIKNYEHYDFLARKCTEVAEVDDDIVNFGVLKKYLQSHLGIKSIAVFGDSITCSGGTNWPYTVKNILKCEIDFYAQSGGHWEDFENNNSDIRWFKNQVTKFINSNKRPDVIVIAMGTNSMWADYGDFTATVDAPFDTLNTRTVYGGMRNGLERLRKTHPDVPIYLTTPLQRAAPRPDDPLVVNMISAIKKMGAWFGCEIFDCNAEVGIVSAMEKHTPQYLPDGLHPNASGSELQGRYIAAKINSSFVNKIVI